MLWLHFASFFLPTFCQTICKSLNLFEQEPLLRFFFLFFCFLLNSNTYFAGRRHARSAKDCNMWIKSLTTAAHSKHTCTCTYRWTGTVGRRSEQFALYLQRFFLLLLVSFALLSPHFSNRFAVLFIYSFSLCFQPTIPMLCTGFESDKTPPATHVTSEQLMTIAHTRLCAYFHGKMQLNVFNDDLCAVKATRRERKREKTEMFAATAIDRKK